MGTRCGGTLFGLFLAIAPGIASAQGKIDLPVPLSTLEQRVKADSNDPAAHYNVALGYWNAKKWKDVDRELRAALKLDPRFAAAHLALAYLPEARNPDLYKDLTRIDEHTPDSVRDALKQRDVEFRHAFLIDPLVDMRIIAAVTQGIDYWDLRDVYGDQAANGVQGLTDCEEGHYTDCELNLATYIRDFGNSKHVIDEIPEPVIWYHAIAAAHDKHYDVAITDFEKLISRDSVAVARAEKKDVIRFPIRTNEYRYFIGIFQQEAGQSDAAIATLHDALEHDLSLYIAHVRLAEIYESRKDFTDAISERRDAVNADPDDPTLNIDLGITLGRAGQFADAADALKAAVTALPRNTDAWFWYGIAMQQLGRTDDARKAFSQVIAVAPSRMAPRVAQAKQRLASIR